MASIFKRGSIWVCQYRNPEDGKICVRSLKTSDPAMARLRKKEIEVAIGMGRYQHAQQRHIEFFMKEYVQDTGYRKKITNHREKKIVEAFIKATDKKTINTMSQDDVIQFIKRYDEHAPKTFNNVLIALRRFFRLAVQKGYILKNPIDGLHRKRVPQSLPKFLSDEEFTRIEKAAELEQAYPMILVARYTGLRLRELLNLEWQDFDWERKLLRVLNKPHYGHTVKNYQNRVVPICDELKEKLGPFIQQEGFCFKTYGRWRKGQQYLSDGPKRQIRRILEAAGIKRDFPTAWHAFRHTFASRLAQNGVSLKKISLWLGHSSIAVTEIYARFSPNYDEDIEKLSLEKLSIK